MDATEVRERRRVRVWFGTYPIADYTAEADLAAQYEAAMRRRFGSLRVTSDLLLEIQPTEPAGPAQPLPAASSRSGVGPASRADEAGVPRSHAASASSYQVRPKSVAELQGE